MEKIKNGWDLSKLTIEGSSEVYVRYEGKFVARFKYANKKKSAKHFRDFMVANFTPEEYFTIAQKNAPLTVLQTKGYVSYNMGIAKSESMMRCM